MKYVPLLWNEVHRIKDIQYEVYLGVKVLASTRSLTVPTLDPRWEKKLALLAQLYDQWITTRRITDWFNDIGLLTERGSSWSPSLVWVTIKKWKKRQHRLRDNYIISDLPIFDRLVPESSGNDWNDHGSISIVTKTSHSVSGEVLRTISILFSAACSFWFVSIEQFLSSPLCKGITVCISVTRGSTLYLWRSPLF